ncbi:MAG: DUF2948 family protein, partial [Hyphomicrobiales bacterium]|nr:DUF2948 family protein [Hyphomicrobiales bacterium]
MPAADRLRLIALDAEDLAVLSAHLQDAVVKAGDMSWLPGQKRFALVLNRFAWEAVEKGLRRKKSYQRRRTGLHFDRVASVQSSAIDRAGKDNVLSLLAVQFHETESPAGEVHLVFSGGGTIRLSVECLEA